MDREILRTKGVFDYEDLIVAASRVKDAAEILMNADKRMQTCELLSEEEFELIGEAIKVLISAENRARTRIRESREKLFRSAI